MVNWNKVLRTKNDVEKTKSFVRGDLSGRQLYRWFVKTQVGGQIRNLLRRNGVQNARYAARKALKRRKFTYNRANCVVNHNVKSR